MHRRLSSTEKGKAVALEHQPAPRVGRVRVSEPTTITDNHRHVLTLIGRVTNPSVQKVWSLIPFFTDHWKADIPPIGSDLGLGMFQFKFEFESDLLTVLEKGPYHYARWMVILQRWEPTISPSFPSMIPFWIKIQGIPIHLWSEEVAIKIGEDLGTYESAEIMAQSFRMRVHINGRLPIIKTSIIEYPNGDEITATLVYEKLEKHCLHCGKLDHEQRDCLEAKHQKKALLAAHEGSQRSVAHGNNEYDRAQHDYNYSGGPARHSPRREKRYRPYARSESNGRSIYPNPKDSPKRHHQRDIYPHRDGHSSEKFDRMQYLRKEREDPRHRNNSSRSLQETFSGASHTDTSHPLNERSRSPVHDKTAHDIVAFTRRPYKDHLAAPSRGDPRGENNDHFPLEDLAVARGEIREVMLQYTSCADPTESAARRERVRKAEAQGTIDESATKLVRASLAHKETANSPISPSSPMEEMTEHIPIIDRLGPLNKVPRDPVPRAPIMARLGPLLDEVTTDEIDLAAFTAQAPKRKPGRPPGRRKVASSPMQGASSKKRQVQQAKPPLTRKKPPVEQGRGSKSTKGHRKSKESPSTENTREIEGTTSENLPICNMIPPAARLLRSRNFKKLAEET
ncbi:hypothetical protein Bca4012_006688 [Brassica carinata]